MPASALALDPAPEGTHTSEQNDPCRAKGSACSTSWPSALTGWPDMISIIAVLRVNCQGYGGHPVAQHVLLKRIPTDRQLSCPWITSYRARWPWNVEEALKFGISLEQAESNLTVIVEVQRLPSREVNLPCRRPASPFCRFDHVTEGTQPIAHVPECFGVFVHLHHHCSYISQTFSGSYKQDPATELCQPRFAPRRTASTGRFAEVGRNDSISASARSNLS